MKTEIEIKKGIVSLVMIPENKMEESILAELEHQQPILIVVNQRYPTTESLGISSATISGQLKPVF